MFMLSTIKLKFICKGYHASEETNWNVFDAEKWWCDYFLNKSPSSICKKSNRAKYVDMVHEYTLLKINFAQ